MKKYLAFISYRHSEYDKKMASGLHRRLEQFHVPNGSEYSGKRKLFRDEEELPTSADLGAGINDALLESEYLIIICSPLFPQSKWCLREVETFIESGRKDRILPVLISGDEESSVPEMVRDIPIVADLRGKRKPDEIVPRLLSIMTGIKEDDIERKEFLHNVYVYAAIMLSVAAILAGFSIYSAGITRKIELNNQEIREATDLAEKAEESALKERDNAILSRADTLSEESLKMMEAGDYDGAIRNILQVLPSDENPDIPYTAETMAVLRTAMSVPEMHYKYLRSMYPDNKEDQKVYEKCLQLVTDAQEIRNDELLNTLTEVRAADQRDFRLAVVREDGILDIYSLSSNKKLISSQKKYRNVYYPFETRSLYAITEDGDVELLDGDSLELIRKIHCTSSAKGMCACPNKNYLLITCEKSVEVYRLENGKRVFTAPAETEPLFAVFNDYWKRYATSDGETFYVVYDDHIDIFNTELPVNPETSDFVPFIDESYDQVVEGWDCTPDGKALILQSNSGDLYWWDTETGNLRLRTENTDYNYSFTSYSPSVSADGKYIWQPQSGLYHRLRKIDIETGEVIYEIELPESGEVFETPSGKCVVIDTLSRSRYVVAIDGDTGEICWSIDGGDRFRYTNLTVSGDGSGIMLIEDHLKEFSEPDSISYVVIDVESGKETQRKLITDIPDDVEFVSHNSMTDKMDILLRHKNEDASYDENLLVDMMTGEITVRVVLPYKTGTLSEGTDCLYASGWEEDDTGRVTAYYYQMVNEDGTVGEPIRYKDGEFVKDMWSANGTTDFGGHRLINLTSTVYDYDTGEPYLYTSGLDLFKCGERDRLFIYQHKNFSGILYPSDDETLITKARKRVEAEYDK